MTVNLLVMNISKTRLSALENRLAIDCTYFHLLISYLVFYMWMDFFLFST